jgi:pimeloyl-ACP methyl ester carboxylesterase
MAVAFLWIAPAIAASPVGRWVGSAKSDGEQWRIVIDIRGETPGLTASVDFADLASYGVPFTITTTRTGVRLERPQPGGAPIVIEAVVHDGIMSGTFSGVGVVNAPLEAERDPVLPERIREEPVRFHNGDVTLSGTILWPAGVGPFPGMVCTHGSGAIVRGFGAYRSEGIFYARLGLATLIYDKRGSGESSGDLAAASLEDLADDAIAALHTLKSHEGVVPSAVGLSGISQGGWVAPLAATRSDDVAFLIVISPSAVNPMEQSIFSVANALRQAGYGEDVVQRASELRKRLYRLARGGEGDPQLASALEAVHEEPWFPVSQLPYPVPTSLPPGERAFLLFEPLPVWRKVTVPVLAIWGGRDTQVPSQASKAMIEGALNQSSHQDHTLILYPIGDHNLRTTGSKRKGAFPRVIIGARQVIAEWLRERLSVDHGQWSP